MKIMLQGVYKYIETQAGSIKLLENINLEVHQGEFMAIMGPSGSGKSTLLYQIGCLDIPSFGHIFLDEVDISQEPESIREQIRLHHIGFVFQNYNLLPTLTVIENIMLPMQFSGAHKGERKARAASLLRLVNLASKENEKPTNLSGGQQQRVAIARAMANDPGIILADEPTGNLDGKSGKEVLEVLHSIHENQRISLVLVTHDPKVASYADKIFYLDDGKLRATVF
ncbi:MAG: ABC transporter ATP-binding protein [Candidatus Eremiobacteraeota bacterium]|nr:ABC transporter ATP-binding protein [Candidatus Eremiobacteraeota bacterium]